MTRKVVIVSSLPGRGTSDLLSGSVHGRDRLTP
jgi:hypothetical protein